VAEGRKTVAEAASVASQMKAAQKAEKKVLDFDVTHKVLKALEAVSLIGLDEYHRAANSMENAKLDGDTVQIALEDAITHLQKAAEAVRIIEAPNDRNTITANLN